METVADISKTPPRLDASSSDHSNAAAGTFGPRMFPPSFTRWIRRCDRREVARVLVKNSIAAGVSTVDLKSRKESRRIKVGDGRFGNRDRSHGWTAWAAVTP